VSGDLRDRLYAEDTPRPWLTWFLLNPVEFVIGLGLSSTAVVLGALARWRRSRGAGVTGLWAVLLTLLLVNLSGAARAEWSRMLMFAMPLLLAGASGALGPLGLRRPGPACALVFAQGAYALIGYQLFEVWGVWATMFR